MTGNAILNSHYELITLHDGGTSSGTCHLLLHLWHFSISGLLNLPQFWHVTRVILRRESLYVIYPTRPKAIAPVIHNNLSSFDKPMKTASFEIREAKNIDNIMEGKIIQSALKKFPK